MTCRAAPRSMIRERSFSLESRAGVGGIFTGNGGAVTTIVDLAGPFSGLGSAPAINNMGQVAFLGTTDSAQRGFSRAPIPSPTR